jgi:hypothetical protein
MLTFRQILLSTKFTIAAAAAARVIPSTIRRHPAAIILRAIAA